jgi:hypothetical protein
VDPSAAWTKSEKTIMTAMAPPKELVLAKTATKAPHKEQNGLDNGYVHTHSHPRIHLVTKESTQPGQRDHPTKDGGDGSSGFSGLG